MPHPLALAVEIVTTVLAVAGTGYFLAALIAARVFVSTRRRMLRRMGQTSAAAAFAPGVSILKSLKGLDPGMLDAFRSHCRQNYRGDFELLFGVSSLADPAAAAVKLLEQEFPEIPVRLVECPECLGTNGKVSTLAQLAAHAQYDYLLINDSDITVSPQYLERVMACFAAGQCVAGAERPAAEHAVLKGHDFSRAVNSDKMGAVFAVEGARAGKKLFPQGLKPDEPLGPPSGTAEAVPFQGTAFHHAESAAYPHVQSAAYTHIQSDTGPNPVGMVTALYRGRAHGSVFRNGLAAHLESLGIATDFMPGVLVSRMIERGLHYGLGSTLAVSREALDAAGGLLPLVDQLADDHELGVNIARAGYRIEICAEVVETSVPAYGWRGFIDHQLRWLRTVRDMRPGGYAGLIFTHGLGLALLNVLASGLSPVSLWLLALSFFLRLSLAMTVGAEVLSDRQVLPALWLLPFRDLVAMGLWAAGFASNTIVWRGERFELRKGKLEKRVHSS